MVTSFRLALSSCAVVGVLATAAAQPARTTEPFHAGVTDAASLEREVGARLEQAKRLLDELLTVQGQRTVENTLVLFDRMREQAWNARWLATAMDNHPDEAMRRATERLRVSSAGFWREVTSRPEVYDALAAIDRARVADAEARHYLERTLQELRRDGVALDKEARADLQRSFRELNATTAEFDRNLREGSRSITVIEADLEGVPRDFIARQRRNGDGTLTLVTNRTDMEIVLTFARSPELRRRAFAAWRSVAYPENDNVLQRMLVLREQIARALGFATWADYHAASRMTKNSAAVGSFIDAVLRASERKASAEYRELLERKRRDEPGAPAV